jgi:hypothetical protein
MDVGMPDAQFIEVVSERMGTTSSLTFDSGINRHHTNDLKENVRVKVRHIEQKVHDKIGACEKM